MTAWIAVAFALLAALLALLWLDARAGRKRALLRLERERWLHDDAAKRMANLEREYLKLKKVVKEDRS